MLQHHGSRPDLADGVGNSLPGDVGSGAVDGLEHGWKYPFRVDICRRGDSDCAGDAGTEVGQNVSEEIAGDYYAEALGRHDKPGGENINVILVGADPRIL